MERKWFYLEGVNTDAARSDEAKETPRIYNQASTMRKEWGEMGWISKEKQVSLI